MLAMKAAEKADVIEPRVVEAYMCNKVRSAQEILSANVTGRVIRLIGHGRWVTRCILGSRLPARHYAICLYCCDNFYMTNVRSSIFV